MASNGFFVAVEEVESVNERKGRPGFPPALYARLRLSGATLSVKIKDGVNVPVGWSGMASGSVRIVTMKREFNGKLSDAVVLAPFEIDDFRPFKQVKQEQTSALASFMASYQANLDNGKK